MPTRMLRDGILTSERVNALSERAELFYRRLMSVVDDYGRYTANPTLLRSACYPLKVDSVKEDSIKKHLAEAAGAGLIVLYTVGGKEFLEIQDFGQRIQSKSKCPDPAGNPQKSTVDHGGSRGKTALVGVEDEDEKSSSASADADAPPSRADAIPYQAIVDAYNATLTGLPKVREVTGKRRTAIRREWQVSAQRRSLGFWQAYFAECQDDDFLNGTGPYREPHANWRPDFDYLLRAEVVTRTFERAMDRLERGA